MAVDLKHPDGVRLVLDLVERGRRAGRGLAPGVAERLGLGPDDCLERNPRLVYGRMTGWGQDGPLAQAAGHDINYIALAGALWAIGRAGERPVPPLNLVGDFGGGGMLLAFGVVAALLEARTIGPGPGGRRRHGRRGRLAHDHDLRLPPAGLWTDERGVNILDTGAPFYEVYDTADGKGSPSGPSSPTSTPSCSRLLGLDAEELPAQNDREQWPAMKERFAAVFRHQDARRMGRGLRRDRRLWGAGPLPLGGAHPPPQRVPRHVRGSRRRDTAGPRAQLQKDAGGRAQAPVGGGSRRDEALRSWGIGQDRIAALRAEGAVD